MKNLLLIYGGGGSEHDVSVVSSKYLKELLRGQTEYNVFVVEIGKDRIWRTEDGDVCELNYQKELTFGHQKHHIHVVVPCIHGFPGETGELPAYFEVIGLPYIGCSSEASHICFNKVTTKLWLNAVGVANTPFAFLTNTHSAEMEKAKDFQKKHKDVFIKAASQGSSVGCYPAPNGKDFEKNIKEAFKYSENVIIEKMVNGRELEVSVYEYDGKVHVSRPGEIICPSKFYSYEEKYSKTSKTEAIVVAENVPADIVKKMQEMAEKAFKALKLRHLSRIDFFLEGNELYINEINTFPGFTPISMFPKMLEANGHSVQIFLMQVIAKASA
ncbi:MAG: D-alanine--D-alanine ligase [Bacteriovoracaceae bacterium]|nr:D-alanine--D-alanine ligase [Bacteriovoracaceae bacterium]